MAAVMVQRLHSGESRLQAKKHECKAQTAGSCADHNHAKA